MNVVCTGTGDFVEIQGTAEREPFSRAMLGQPARPGHGRLRRADPAADRGPRRQTRSARARSVADAARRVVLATRNAGKVAELNRILADVGGRGRARRARGVPRRARRARDRPHVRRQRAAEGPRDRRAAPGCPPSPTTPAWPSTRCNGMPGVLSARWAGRHGDDDANLELLLGQLADVRRARGAAFVCVAALALPSGSREWTATGVLSGQLTRAPRGSERLRLRPDLRPRGPDHDHGGAGAGREGRDQPPRPRLPRHRPAHRRPRLAPAPAVVAGTGLWRRGSRRCRGRRSASRWSGRRPGLRCSPAG